jgi:hypothetical protein
MERVVEIAAIYAMPGINYPVLEFKLLISTRASREISVSC